MKSIKLDIDILREALHKMKSQHGRGVWAELQRVSGAHNLGRIYSGETEPTVESWIKLHDAYPDDIPPPTRRGGRPLFRSVATSSSRYQFVRFPEFYRMCEQYASPVLIGKWQRHLEQIADVMLER